MTKEVCRTFGSAPNYRRHFGRAISSPINRPLKVDTRRKMEECYNEAPDGHAGRAALERLVSTTKPPVRTLRPTKNG